jgi:hypothetical protein
VAGKEKGDTSKPHTRTFAQGAFCLLHKRARTHARTLSAWISLTSCCFSECRFISGLHWISFFGQVSRVPSPPRTRLELGHFPAFAPYAMSVRTRKKPRIAQEQEEVKVEDGENGEYPRRSEGVVCGEDFSLLEHTALHARQQLRSLRQYTDESLASYFCELFAPLGLHVVGTGVCIWWCALWSLPGWCGVESGSLLLLLRSAWPFLLFPSVAHVQPRAVDIASVSRLLFVNFTTAELLRILCAHGSGGARRLSAVHGATEHSGRAYRPRGLLPAGGGSAARVS